jgi:hypothetical protein
VDQSIVDLRNQLLATGLEIERRLAGLTEADLALPATWRGQEFNIRFLLHRLAAHLRDHELQVRKTRRALGAPPSEAQMILAQAMEARAALLGECVGLSAEQFEAAPAEGEWSAKQVLEHAVAVEKRNLETLEKVLADAGKA